MYPCHFKRMFLESVIKFETKFKTLLFLVYITFELIHCLIIIMCCQELMFILGESKGFECK